MRVAGASTEHRTTGSPLARVSIFGRAGEPTPYEVDDFAVGAFDLFCLSQLRDLDFPLQAMNAA